MRILLLSLALLAACQAQRIPLDSNYAATETGCHSGALAHESDQGFSLLKDLLREGWKREGRSSAEIVLTGDSTIALFLPDRIARYMPGKDVANRAIGGETTAGLRERLGRDVTVLRPRVIIFAIGGNDILGGRCLREALQNTQAIIQQLKSAAPGSRIIVVSVPPVILERANLVSPYYNKKLEFLAHDMQVEYFDLWPLLSDGTELRSEFRYKLPNGRYDQVHFNEKGYEVFGRALLTLLK